MWWGAVGGDSGREGFGEGGRWYLIFDHTYCVSELALNELLDLHNAKSSFEISHIT